MRRDHSETILPQGYVALEYLQSTGTQYIDTGIKLTDDNGHSSFYARFSYQDSKGKSLFGAQDNTKGYLCITPFIWLDGNKKLYTLCGRTTPLFTIANTYSDFNTINEFFISADNGSYSSEWNGTRYTGTYTKGYPTTRNIYIFTNNHSTSASFLSQRCLAKLYEFSMEIGDDTYQYLPALREADNKPGLYELNHGIFLTNIGTGEFLYQ